MSSKKKGFRLCFPLLAVLLLLGLQFPARTTVAEPPDPEAYYAELAQQSHPELVEERDRYSTVFQATADLKMMRISATPTHYLDTNGQWLEISTAIAPSSDKEYEYEATRNDFQVHFSRDSNKDYLVRYGVQGKKIEFGFEKHQAWGDRQTVDAAVDGSQVVYAGLYPGVDLRYGLSAERLLEELTINSAAAAAGILTVEKTLKITGVDYVLNADGSIDFLRKGGRKDRGDVLWRIPPPVMYELNYPGESHSGLHFEVQQRGSKFYLNKVLDPEGRAWLTDANRQFPVVIDDTVDLDESAMYIDANVRFNGSTYARLANLDRTYLGKSGTWRYRGFESWNTGAIPDGANLQAVGLYLYLVTQYGAGNTVDVVRLANDPATRADNLVWTDIGNETTTYLNDSAAFQSTGNGPALYLSLGWQEANSPALTDLQSMLATDARFAVGFRGSNESSAITAFSSSESTTLARRPDLVLFYDGVSGSPNKLARPLRQSFYDGSRYWVFFAHSDPNTGSLLNIDYYYSSDGEDWTRSGTIDNARNDHHALWYEGGTTVWVAYHHQPLMGNIEVKIGAISGTAISWTADSVPFAATATIGYDFPSIVRDSQGYCWVMARRYTAQNKHGIAVVRSTSPQCTAWGTSTTLLPVQSVSGNEDIGGYVAPLTNGRVYAVYKAVTSIRGRLYNGTAWETEEVIDATASFGIYHQGMSVVAIGDVVHLVYVDANGSLMYASRNGSWAPALVLATGTFYGASLSLDTVTNNLYAMYHTTGGPDGPGVMYVQTGAPPYAAPNWTTRVLETGLWMPQTYQGSNNYYDMHSNYSGNGRIFCFWVEGIYGLEFASVLP